MKEAIPEKIQAFKVEMEALQKKHGVYLKPFLLVTPGGITPQIRIYDIEENKKEE